MANIHFQILQLQKPNEWPHWQKQFKQFCIASGLAAEIEEHQINILLYCLDDDAEDVLHSTNISKGDRKMYVGNWNSRKREQEWHVGMEHRYGNLHKLLLSIGFFTSEVHRTV